MIGNDIIDLKEAEKKSNWRRKGFLEKIYTKNERIYIENSENPDLIVWFLWSMKESAFKAEMRSGNEKYFSPLKYQCRIVSEICGEILVNKSQYFSYSFYNNNFISTYVINKNIPDKKIFNNVIEFHSEFFENQREENYKELIKNYCLFSNKNFYDISVKKNKAGIPFLLEKNSDINIPVSLSHHGKYGAFIFLYN